MRRGIAERVCALPRHEHQVGVGNGVSSAPSTRQERADRRQVESLCAGDGGNPPNDICVPKDNHQGRGSRVRAHSSRLKARSLWLELALALAMPFKHRRLSEPSQLRAQGLKAHGSWLLFAPPRLAYRIRDAIA